MIDLSLKSLMSHSEPAGPAARDHAGRTVGTISELTLPSSCTVPLKIRLTEGRGLSQPKSREK